MKSTYLTLFILFLSTPILFAQNENKIWAFGSRAGLDFSNGTPQAIRTGMDQAIVNEGCASICNVDGKLLFYTNGSKIWNRNHTLMPNGNLGLNTLSTMQGALIVPVPGSDHIYYVFSLESIDGSTNKQKLYYSIVDMRLEGGLGAVVDNMKSILIAEQLSERMSAVAGDNCSVWIVVRNDYVSEYQAYLLTAEGLNTNPVISAVTSVSSNFNLGHAGMLKFSHDRKKIATGRRGLDELLELADFDPATGIISNNRIIRQSSNTMGIYGVCFSPDDSKLYVSTGYGSPSDLIQYDLSSNNLATIQASATILHAHNKSGSGIGDIKEGIDGKLYFTTSTSSVFNSEYIHVINKPNLTGVLAEVRINAISLLSNTFSGHGLPNQVVTFPPKDTISSSQNVTMCDETYTLPVDTSGSFYTWENGNKAAIRVISRAGTYFVRYRKACTIYVDTFIARKLEFPKPSPTDAICANEKTGEIHFTATDTTTFIYSYVDSTGNIIAEDTSRKGSSLKGLKYGVYKVIINHNGCEKEFEVRIDSYPMPNLVLQPENDTTIRYGDYLQLQAQGASVYRWTPEKLFPEGDATVSNPSIRPLEPTSINVVGTNAYGCKDEKSLFVNIDYFIPDLIPNAFSPNGDGLNDIFKIEGITYQRILHFNIFNRFGQIVFQTMSPETGWDGTFNGAICEAGTYFYSIQLSYPNGEKKSFKGDVTLLR